MSRNEHEFCLQLGPEYDLPLLTFCTARLTVLCVCEHLPSYQSVSSFCSILRALDFSCSLSLGIKLPLHQALPGCESGVMTCSNLFI